MYDFGSDKFTIFFLEFRKLFSEEISKLIWKNVKQSNIYSEKYIT